MSHRELLRLSICLSWVLLFVVGCAISRAATPAAEIRPTAPVPLSPTTAPSSIVPTVTLFSPTPSPLPSATFTPEPNFLVLQQGNYLPKVKLAQRRSQELEDNHIGTDLGSYDPGYANTDVVYPIGFKWIRLSFSGDPLNWQRVEREPGQYTIHAGADEKISQYARNGIHILLNLGVGDWEGRLDTTRFAAQSEVERYGNFVRFMVGHFKDRIQYYELWNEPGDITVNNYARLVRHVIPIIRQEYPEAKVVIGAVPGNWEFGYPGYGESGRSTVDKEYLRGLLMSGVAPFADGISWHPFYGTRPDDPYYQTYPQWVKELKELAASQGFKGEFFAEESVWRTPGDQADPMIQRVSETVATKYLLRTIVIHRGLDVIVTIALPGAHDPTLPKVQAIHNLCSAMAGADPLSIPVEVQSEAKDVESYGFALPNGDRYIALWVDNEAVDEHPGVRATLTVPGYSVQQVVAMDVLNGFEQAMLISDESGNLVIRDLLIKDYPILLRLTPSR